MRAESLIRHALEDDTIVVKAPSARWPLGGAPQREWLQVAVQHTANKDRRDSMTHRDMTGSLLHPTETESVCR